MLADFLIKRSCTESILYNSSVCATYLIEAELFSLENVDTCSCCARQLSPCFNLIKPRCFKDFSIWKHFQVSRLFQIIPKKLFLTFLSLIFAENIVGNKDAKRVIYFSRFAAPRCPPARHIGNMAAWLTTFFSRTFTLCDLIIFVYMFSSHIWLINYNVNI